MGTKKISGESQAQADDQAGSDTGASIAGVSQPDPAAQDSSAANSATLSDPAAEAPPPAIPDPIFATDDAGRDRPMSGGSFIRREDGTLIRNEDA